MTKILGLKNVPPADIRSKKLNDVANPTPHEVSCVERMHTPAELVTH